MADNTTKEWRGCNRWLTLAWTTVTAIILLTPLLAMRFTDWGVNWTLSDFTIAGGLLLGAGVTYELAARIGGFAYQAGAVVALGTGVLIFWTTGAVGIIGSENNPGNLLYLGVLLLAIVGTVVAAGKASRMVWVMILSAIATVAAPVIAYAGIADPASDVLGPEVFAATAIFAIGWSLAAFFFKKAAGQ